MTTKKKPVSKTAQTNKGNVQPPSSFPIAGIGA
jgi:hypothetical protein